MKLISFLLLLLSGNLLAQVSFGDGSDGYCTWSGAAPTEANNNFNCTDVYVPAGTTVQFTHADVITIRATGTVTIDGTLDVSASGSTTSGPGGGDGGLCSGAPCGSNNAIGTTGGEGQGGAVAGDGGTDFADYGGGGGSGGWYGGSVQPIAGGNGALASGSLGVGGAQPNQNYGNEANFLTSFQGGVGGGAGGSGEDFNDVQASGGNGGDGGGAIAIFAEGSITVSSTGQILANGGNGDTGATTGLAGGGGGGGGSGGSIYLYSLDMLSFDGDILVDGGTGGAGGAGGPGGSGSDGSIGRIRLDSPSGSYVDLGGANFGGATPLQFVATVPGTTYTSNIGYSCALKEHFDYQNFLVTFFASLILCLCMFVSIHSLINFRDK